ncbi:hypothetical protein KSP40_PGU016397 [Platanthera guangdongensis]|uniref:RelA/SpoT domain-containing protein n=1 Tax=Platanthera guangdongensis TaxID=2320717 RepID=A0ABR2LYI4_9ASPA
MVEAPVVANMSVVTEIGSCLSFMVDQKLLSLNQILAATVPAPSIGEPFSQAEKELLNYLLASPAERPHVKSVTGDQTSWKSLARCFLYRARVARVLGMNQFRPRSDGQLKQKSRFRLPLHGHVSCRSTSSSPPAIRLHSGDWKHVKDQNFSGFVRKAPDSCLDYDSLSFPIPGSKIEEEELTFCLKDTLVWIFPRSCESSVLRLLVGAQSRHAIFHENIVVKTFYEAEKAHGGQAEELVQHLLKNVESARKKLNMDEIFDIHGVRLVVENKGDCFAALNVVHRLWPKVVGKFKDYIVCLKFNG